MSDVFDNPENVAKLTAELDSWRGTPWVHCAVAVGPTRALKGIRTDCTHGIVAAFGNTGFVDAAKIVMPAHGARPGIAGEGESAVSLAKLLAGFVERHILAPVDGELPGALKFGDVLTFRYAGREHHIGVFKGGENRDFWHADRNGFGTASLNEDRQKKALRNAYRLRPIAEHQ